ncbi:MAG: pseudouridine synthase [Patescibacteria group bacterium]
MRINKFIASTGYCSRRSADELVKNGRVTLNGQIVADLSTRIEAGQDIVKIDGKDIAVVNERVIYLLNKPRGVVTTADDPEGRKTVLDFVPKEPRVFPCGRLDIETMGLVVLTNDGNLCYQLTHPKFEHKKEYFVQGVARNPQFSWDKLQKPAVRVGLFNVAIDDRRLRKIKDKKIEFWLSIHEGKYHIVRKLCGAVGIDVIHLTRTKLGDYELGEIEPGHYDVVS